MTPDFQAALAKEQQAMADYAATRTVRAWMVLEETFAELRRLHEPVLRRAEERRARMVAP